MLNKIPYMLIKISDIVYKISIYPNKISDMLYTISNIVYQIIQSINKISYLAEYIRQVLIC